MRITCLSHGLVILALVLSAQVAGAQDARQRAAAAEAYDRGTTDYMTGNYQEAAQWFETAHRMAPAPAALMQAIRAHQKAENFGRAATLAFALQEDYPGEPQAVQYAEQILGELTPSLYRVDVQCSACEIDLDEAVQQGRTFFVEPDVTHSLVAHFSTGDVSRSVRGSAGQTTTLTLSAPMRTTTSSATDPTEPSAAPSDSGGLPPIVTFIGAGVTGALLIATVISGLDANAGVDAYEREARMGDPVRARQLLEDGQGRETRTNVLLGATLVCAAATGVIAAVLTNWSSDESGDTRAAIVPTTHGLMGFVESRF